MFRWRSRQRTKPHIDCERLILQEQQMYLLPFVLKKTPTINNNKSDFSCLCISKTYCKVGPVIRSCIFIDLFSFILISFTSFFVIWIGLDTQVKVTHMSVSEKPRRVHALPNVTSDWLQLMLCCFLLLHHPQKKMLTKDKVHWPCLQS